MNKFLKIVGGTVLGLAILGGAAGGVYHFIPSVHDWTNKEIAKIRDNTVTAPVESETPGTETETPGTGTETPGTETETPGTGTETETETETYLALCNLNVDGNVLSFDDPNANSSKVYVLKVSGSPWITSTDNGEINLFNRGFIYNRSYDITLFEQGHEELAVDYTFVYSVPILSDISVTDSESGQILSFIDSNYSDGKYSISIYDTLDGVSTNSVICRKSYNLGYGGDNNVSVRFNLHGENSIVDNATNTIGEMIENNSYIIKIGRATNSPSYDGNSYYSPVFVYHAPVTTNVTV